MSFNYFKHLNAVFFLGTFFTVATFLTPKTTNSQNQPQSSRLKTIHVKFKEEFQPKASVHGRMSGISKVDVLNEKHHAVQIKRVFPEKSNFEKAHRAFGLHLWYEIQFDETVNLKTVIAEYKSLEYFYMVEERKEYKTVHSSEDSYTPLPTGTNDPYFSNQWHFNNTTTNGADIDLLQAWKIETGSPNVIVAIIDGGIPLKHEDLKDALWINSDEIPNNKIDDDQNGYIDDFHGYGFGDQSPTISPDYHASHVAGIIGAVSNNGIGVSGIAGGSGSAWPINYNLSYSFRHIKYNCICNGWFQYKNL